MKKKIFWLIILIILLAIGYFVYKNDLLKKINFIQQGKIENVVDTGKKAEEFVEKNNEKNTGSIVKGNENVEETGKNLTGENEKEKKIEEESLDKAVKDLIESKKDEILKSKTGLTEADMELINDIIDKILENVGNEEINN